MHECAISYQLYLLKNEMRSFICRFKGSEDYYLRAKYLSNLVQVYSKIETEHLFISLWNIPRLRWPQCLYVVT